MVQTDNLPEQSERYREGRTATNEYVEGGKTYTVTRFFTGDKNLNELIAELAVRRADREAGLL